MHYQGINANMMSLGGIAIAIGAMVDAAIVMIENMHKVLEQWRHDNPGKEPAPGNTGVWRKRRRLKWDRRCFAAC